MAHNCINKGVLSVMTNSSLCESPSLRFSKFLNVPSESSDKANEIMSFVAYYNRQKNNLPAASKFFPKNSRQIPLRLGGKLIVNQAGGVLENVGISLHRTFSYPYIPGSAVKGVVRHAAWEAWAAESDENKKFELAEKIAMVFGFPTGDKKPKEKASARDYLDNYLWSKNPEKYGTEKQSKSYSGSVAFLNAVPLLPKKVELDTDICTCHHMDYYKPKGSAHPVALDDEEPNPQIFPVVQAGAEFCFCIAPLKHDADLDFAEQMLKAALSVNGIGGKTAAGYGWFEEDSKLSNVLEREKKLSSAGNSVLVSKFMTMKGSELGEFLKKPELSEEEKEAFKIAYETLPTGLKNKTKEFFKKGKGVPYKNIISVWGENEAQALFAQ